MNLIVHPPITKEGKDELKRIVATAHVELIYSKINTLPITQTKKCDLIKSIADSYHEKSTPL